MNARPARRRTSLVAAMAAAAALLTAGCSVAAPSVPTSEAAPTAASSTAVPSATISAAPSPTTSAAPSQAASLPSGWDLCANAESGYEIGYPANWYTTELNPEQACQQFDPMAFTIPEGGEYPMTALNAVQTQYLFDPGRSGPGMSCSSLQLREPTTVGGRQAVRFEERLNGDGMYADGTMRYGYVSDRDGLEFTVFTMAGPSVSADDYAAWKAVVDQAVETLHFE